MNILRKKLKNREKIFGGWTSIGHPQISEMFAFSGIDFLGIDLEHSTINQEQSQRIITVCDAQGVGCLPRVPSHNPESIKRLLDSGAKGVIVPNVETEKQVQAIINWVKYPPIGQRGFGVSRAQGYGFNFENYVSNWNENSVIIIQIESVEAVRNIKHLLNYDEVDGVMIGPYDLSGSLGIPGQIHHAKVLNAVNQVYEACREFGKACGPHEVEPSLESVNQAFDSGGTFVVLSSDIFIFWKWGEKMKCLINEFKSDKIVL